MNKNFKQTLQITGVTLLLLLFILFSIFLPALLHGAPTYAVVYAEEIREKLGDRYCKHEGWREQWDTLLQDVNLGRTFFVLRVCHVTMRSNGGKEYLEYKYRLVATSFTPTLDKWNETWHNRLSWDEVVTSQLQ